MNDLSDEQKEFFKAAAAHRKAMAIKLGRWCVTCDTAAICTFHELFESWVLVFGKEGAIDHLVEAMAEEHHLIRARLLYAKENRRGRKPKDKNPTRRASSHSAGNNVRRGKAKRDGTD